MTVHSRNSSIFRILSLLLLLAILSTGSRSSALAQETAGPSDDAAALLASLSVEERVGQLFLVNFYGSEITPESDIFDLIVNHHIGGVTLRADHDNFIGPEETLDKTVELVQALQQTEWNSTQGTITETITGEQLTPFFIPLFIGISQPGDGAPWDQIRSGLTELPSPMAIGATWNRQLAEEAGFVSGQELSALGFNLLLGPSLDVLESPIPEGPADLGIQTFGGDPYWVGQMGSAFIKGVHAGSQNRIAVIGTHFPGVGGADRPLEEEVSTVRKSLEQLKQIELAPFFEVTGESPAPENTADGLLISHIRYQGFLGNIRATTRPISFDEASFAEIISLPEFSGWREAGGIMITDDLGSRAVRRFYDPFGLSFNARLVVRDAFLAGNDMLYLGDILDPGDEHSYQTVQRIVEFFTQRYREDQAFARRVDESVLRILTVKYRINETFSLEETLPKYRDIETLGKQQQTSFEIARQGATLVSPEFEDLDTVLPDAPTIEDRMIFITDVGAFQQCTTCLVEKNIDVDAFEAAILRLYGPEAGNQVQPENMISFTFENLINMLNGESATSIESNLRSTDWIVIAMTDINTGRPESLALRRLLSERDELIRGKRIIVFSFNKPYLLDATDISKLTAYYALYSKNDEALDTASRILFKEFAPTFGSLPVSVPGIGYDLISATSPDPNQSIQVELDLPIEASETVEEPTPTISTISQFQIGDQILLRTDVILDHNGNPVPDGTPVQFTFNVNGVESFSPGTTTFNGIARTAYLVTEPGTVQIGIITEPATPIIPLEIVISIPEGFVTPEPVTPTPIVDPTDIPEPTPTNEPIVEPETEPPPPAKTQTDLVDWILSLLASVLIAFAAYRVGVGAGRVRWSIRWGLSSLLGGLIAYTYLSLNLPGSLELIEAGRGGALWASMIGAGAGWILGVLWRLFFRTNSTTSNSDPAEIAKTQSR